MGRIKEFFKVPSDETINYIRDNSIKISLICSSIRPNLWMRAYESLSNNYVDFEMICCGDVRPSFSLPDNLIYIYSEVKPSQCFEIARRRAAGDFVMMTGDDLLYNKYFLDNMVEAFLKENNSRVIVSAVCGGARDNKQFVSKKRGKYYRYWGAKEMSAAQVDPLSIPEFALGAFSTKSLYDEMEGFDKNFVGLMAEADFVMRVRGLGGVVAFSEFSLFFEEKAVPRLSQGEYGLKSSKDVLNSMWCQKYRGEEIDSDKFYEGVVNGLLISKQRLIPFEPYVDNNIALESQGPKGKWK